MIRDNAAKDAWQIHPLIDYGRIFVADQASRLRNGQRSIWPPPLVVP